MSLKTILPVMGNSLQSPASLALGNGPARAMEGTLVETCRPSAGLTVHEVCKSYRDGLFKPRLVNALLPLSAFFEEGEVVGIVGPNGAGKSTLLKILSGVLPPDTGHVMLDGKTLSPRALRRLVGYVSNHVAPYARLTVRENILFRARLHEVPRDVALRRCSALLESYGLARLQHRAAAGLSTGENQKLRLVSALIQDPALLVLDEPTTGLDMITTCELFDTIAQLAGEGRTLLLCSHTATEIERVCGSLLVLHTGRAVFRGPCSALGSGAAFEASLLELLRRGAA